MPESIMLEKAKIFAIDIVNVCKEIKSKYRESVLTNQLIRSGTSIGANIHESKYAHGTADFIAKMQISRNVMNLNIGLNFYLKQIILKKLNINNFKIYVVQFAVC